MRSKKDVAPLMICLREKENTSHKGMEARSKDKTNIGVVFEAPLQALPVHKNTNSENYKYDDDSFSFVTALLAPPKSRGVGRFPFGLSYSSAINGVTGSVT